MAPRKIRIIYLIDYFRGIGGTERHLSHLVLNLPTDLFDCKIVAFDLGPNILNDKMRSRGIPVLHVPVGREYTPNALLRARDLSRIIKASGVDIIQTYHQKSDSFGALIAKFSGVKHIVSSKRDMGENRKPWHIAVNKALGNLFEKVIVAADAVGQTIALREGLPASRIVRIYNGVDPLQFSPPTDSQRDAERTRLGFGAEDFVVGMVANFRPEKNHHVFFEGAARALSKIPSLKILAIGDGPLLEHFRMLYANEPIGAKIVFAGATPDVRGHLRAMDVGCLIPGKNEGFSNSIIEKMAVGLPLIVSDVGGNSEAVIDRENGLVIEPNDLEAFVKALLDIYSSKAGRLQMGMKSREFVLEKFTLEKMCKEHETFYLSLIDNHH